MNTYIFSAVLIASVCFLVVAEAQLTKFPPNPTTVCSCCSTCSLTTPTSFVTSTLKPINGTTLKPINGTTSKPINGTTLQPTNGTTSRQTNRTTLQPINGTTLQPINGTTSRPFNGTTLQPINGTTSKPINGTTLQPINGTTSKPINGTTSKPFNGTTLQPFNGTTSRPIEQMCFPNKTYCTIDTCSPTSINTLCQYSTSTWGTACKPPYLSNSIVSATDITTILAVHNKYRANVALGGEAQGSPAGPQPKASNMRQLYWDNELACMAEAWAHQCLNQNDQCRDVLRFQVGQNIFFDSSSSNTLGTSNWFLPISKWYNEVQFMDPAYVPSFPASTTSTFPIVHYTQLVWADTYLVGCATADYNRFNRLYVCNYGPGGNLIGSPVYLKGTAGSACPAGTFYSGSGLCV